jgi:primosomal protein N'
MYSKGTAIIQTFRKDAPEILFAINEDPLGYAAHELPLRGLYNYPPSTRVIDLILRECHNNALPLMERLRPYANKCGVHISLWEKKSALSFASVIRLRGLRVRELLPIIPRKGVVINVDPVE